MHGRSGSSGAILSGSPASDLEAAPRSVTGTATGTAATLPLRLVHSSHWLSRRRAVGPERWQWDSGALAPFGCIPRQSLPQVYPCAPAARSAQGDPAHPYPVGRAVSSPRRSKFTGCLPHSLPACSTFQSRYESERGGFEYVQAAVFDRLKMVLKRIVRASFRRCAASLSLIAVACASSCWKVIPGLRNCSALCSDLSFS